MKRTLTKEFWDQLSLSCPKTMQRFRDFVDQFKKDCEFDKLFLNDRSHRPFGEPLIKFHDLPDLMQIGLVMCFTGDVVREWEFYIQEHSRIKTIQYAFSFIEERFEDLRLHLKKST